MTTGIPRRTAAAIALLVMVSGAACTDDTPGTAPTTDLAGTLTEGSAKTYRTQPKPAGGGSVASAMPAGVATGKRPVQAAPELAGQALPTNQWWTSALTGPGTQPIWAHPLAVQANDGGLRVSSAPVTASANTVVTPFIPALAVGGPLAAVRVTGYGAFHVVLRADLPGGGQVDVTVVQGSPVLYLQFTGATPTIAAEGEPTVQREIGSTVELTVAGQRWDLLADGGTWQRDGNRFTVPGTTGKVAVARVPDGVDAAAWTEAVAGSAADPVIDTTAHMTYDKATGSVIQTLTAKRASGKAGVWALLPHQQAGLDSAGRPRRLAGSYPNRLGPMTLVVTDAVRVRVPMPGLLSAAPQVPLGDTARKAVLADLDRDLADPPGTGGSYFGLKELGRLATIAEVAKAIGATTQQREALARLRPQLVDWLTYSGEKDRRYFAYDSTWGGLIAVPAEFGSENYNDHHFQYGYLVRAAGVLAQNDEAFRRDYADTVDLVVRDYAGGLASEGPTGFPAFRAFNAYSGYSAASGYAAFADGNNQESSSEAVAAWEAAVRWGLVRGTQALVAYGATHYALEAATARAYWLGEGVPRPPGYAHTTAGIVWDAKVDYATWFDPRPESIRGIQLLPLTFGSLYRADPNSAAARSAALTTEAGGPPRLWGDLIAADLALKDPGAARQRLDAGPPREDSTSRAMVRYWVEVLSDLGPPQPAVSADGPYGLAFGGADNATLVAVNPTGTAITVTFYRNGKPVDHVSVDPGQTVIRRR